MAHNLKIKFTASNCNGYPSIRIYLDGDLLTDYTFLAESYEFCISVPEAVAQRQIEIQRYGKTHQNWSPEQDQCVQIIGMYVDDVDIPEFLISKQCRFVFDDQIHAGSRFFGPNGTWYFYFTTPIIQFILDEKIQHESAYNQDYKYPWSYKLGPDSVKNIIDKIDKTLEKLPQL